MKNNLKEGDIDLKPILFKFKTKWYFFAIALAMTLILAFLYTQTATKTYSFKATLLLKGENTGSKETQELLKLLEVKNKGLGVDDQIGLLSSRGIVRKAIERLDFNVSYYIVPKVLLNTFGDLVVEEQYNASPFKIVLEPSANQIINTPVYVEILSKDKYRLRVDGKEVKVYNIKTGRIVQELPTVQIDKTLPINEPYRDGNLTFKLILNEGVSTGPNGKMFFVINDIGGLTTLYQRKLVAKPVAKDSKIIEISTEGDVKDKEVKFMNELMDVFIQNDLEKKNQVGEKTLSFIDNQLSKVDDTLKKAQIDLSIYQSTRELFDIDTQGKTVFQRLESLRTERDRISLTKKYYENMYNYLNSSQQVNDVMAPSSAGVENLNLTNLLNELSVLNRQKAAVGITLKNNDNPMVRVLDGKIENAKKTIIENVNQNIRLSDISLSEVNRRIAQLEGNVSQLPNSQRQLVNLKGKSDYNGKTYDFLLEKKTEAAISLATNAPDMEVIDSAKMVSSEPTFPKTKQIYMIALLLGLVIPAVLIILIDNMDDTIKTKEDLEKETSIPFLGMTTNGDKNTKIALIDKPKSAISESFRSLRVNLQYLAVGMEKKVIGITSSISGEGKTFCSVNLSAELALSGKRTLLIETDLRKPTVSKYFGLSNKIGLSSYLIKGNTIDDIILKTKIKNLDVITSGPIPPNPIELIGSPEMEDLISILKTGYDYIILDIPPIGFVSEYFVLMKYIDANLYVVRQKYTQKALLGQINELYNDKKINHIYLILNDVKYSSTYEFGYKTKAAKYYV